MAAKGWLVVGLGVALVAGLAACCEAQYPMPEDMGLNYSVAIGAAVPIGHVEQSFAPMVSAAWYGSTGEDLGERAAIGLSVDWTLLSRTSGSDASLVPVLFNYKQYGIIGNYRVFVNFGLGILALSDDVPDMKLESGANFGWTGGLGFDLSNNLYGKVRYIGGKNPSDDGLIAVQLGYRF